MKIPKNPWFAAVLSLLLILSMFGAILTLESTVGVLGESTDVSAAPEDLIKYQWAQFMGDSSFSRFSAGPAPGTSDVLWKAKTTARRVQCGKEFILSGYFAFGKCI